MEIGERACKLLVHDKRAKIQRFYGKIKLALSNRFTNFSINDNYQRLLIFMTDQVDNCLTF